MLSELRRDGVVSGEGRYLLGHRTAAEHVLLEDKPQRRAGQRKVLVLPC